MKKTISILTALVAMILIFQINIVVFASQAPTVSSDDIVLTEAETLIPVKIKNNSGLMGYKITVKYDKAKLQVCSVTKGDVSSKGNFITNFNTDIDTFDIVWNNTDNVTKDGNLFVISAKAKKNASGKTEISLSYSQPDTFDVTYTDVRLECEDISVTFEKNEKTTAAAPTSTTKKIQQNSLVADDSQILDAVNALLRKEGKSSLDEIDDREHFLKELNEAGKIMAKKFEIRNSTAEFLIFTVADKEQGVEVLYKDESIWATQKAIATLFDVDRTVVTKHLKNIFDTCELDKEVVCAKIAHTTEHGAIDGKTQTKEVQYYNLDAIISVGYRVNSIRATQFRQWCTYVLRQFAIRGYVIDKKRMENGSFIGEDYFEHLLAEVREIRLSERRFYQKLTDIYATAIDYNRDAPTTRLFFKKVQNKMHYAVHGHTAAELIVQRANSEKEHMGLTSWENAPDGKIVKPDVVIAKNYLKENELENMAQLVNAVLDLAERMAKRHIPMTMEDWAKRIDIILEAGGDAILADAGKITAEFAKEFAESEFEKYRIVQDRLFSSDFDRFNNGDNLLPFDINPDKE